MSNTQAYVEIASERCRQTEKWGEPSYADGTGRPGSRELADYFRAVCKFNGPGTDNWQDILTEEVFEAFAETDLVVLRRELVQSGAVIVAWIEDIDRRMSATAEERG